MFFTAVGAITHYGEVLTRLPGYVSYERDWDDMLEMLAVREIDLVTTAQVTEKLLEAFACSKAVGPCSSMLTVSDENRTVTAGDYGAYNRMRAGLVTGSSRSESFAEFAAEKVFTYKPVYFTPASVLKGPSSPSRSTRR